LEITISKLSKFKPIALPETCKTDTVEECIKLKEGRKVYDENIPNKYNLRISTKLSFKPLQNKKK
jgi:hypothetical protein